RLEEEVRQLESKMSSRSASFLDQETPVTIERVQAAIPEDAALVEYFVYKAPSGDPPRLVAYTLRSSGKMGFVDLGPAAAAEEAAAKFRKSLAASSSKDTQALGRALDELVMRPVRALLDGAKRVLISPDGSLNVVPFDALVDEQNKYLLERL